MIPFHLRFSIEKDAEEKKHIRIEYRKESYKTPSKTNEAPLNFEGLERLLKETLNFLKNEDLPPVRLEFEEHFPEPFKKPFQHILGVKYNDEIKVRFK